TSLSRASVLQARRRFAPALRGYVRRPTAHRRPSFPSMAADLIARGRARAQERPHASARQRVGPLVLVMAGVAFDPVPAHSTARAGRIEALPQLGVLDGLARGRAPALALPGVDPLADAVAQVLRIRV